MGDGMALRSSVLGIGRRSERITLFSVMVAFLVLMSALEAYWFVCFNFMNSSPSEHGLYEEIRGNLDRIGEAEGVNREFVLDSGHPFPDGSGEESLLVWIVHFRRTKESDELLSVQLNNFYGLLTEVTSLEIVVATTSSWADWGGADFLKDDPRVKFKFAVYPSSIGVWLPMMHRYDFKERIRDFDWFMYIEDDLDFQVRHFKHFRNLLEKFRMNGLLEKRYLPGFVLTEWDVKGRRVHVEAGNPPLHGAVIDLAVILDGRPYYSWTNSYEAFYLLPRPMLKQFVELPSWLNYSHYSQDLVPYEFAKIIPNFFGYMEMFAGLGWLIHAPHHFTFSGVFRTLAPLHPDLLVDHLSNNYISGLSNLTLIENIYQLFHLDDVGDWIPGKSVMDEDCFPVVWHGSCVECYEKCTRKNSDEDCFLPFQAQNLKPQH